MHNSLFFKHFCILKDMQAAAGAKRSWLFQAGYRLMILNYFKT